MLSEKEIEFITNGKGRTITPVVKDIIEKIETVTLSKRLAEWVQIAYSLEINLSQIESISQNSINNSEKIQSQSVAMKCRRLVVGHLLEKHDNYKLAQLEVGDFELVKSVITANMDAGNFFGFYESATDKVTPDQSKQLLYNFLGKYFPKENSMTTTNICSFCENFVKQQIFSDGNHRTAIILYYSLHAQYLMRIPRLKAEEVHGCITLLRADGDRFSGEAEKKKNNHLYGRLEAMTGFTFPHKKDGSVDCSEKNIISQLLVKIREVETLDYLLEKLAVFGREYDTKYKNRTSCPGSGFEKMCGMYFRWQRARAMTGHGEAADGDIDLKSVIGEKEKNIPIQMVTKLTWRNEAAIRRDGKIFIKKMVLNNEMIIDIHFRKRKKENSRVQLKFYETSREIGSHSLLKSDKLYQMISTAVAITETIENDVRQLVSECKGDINTCLSKELGCELRMAQKPKSRRGIS